MFFPVSKMPDSGVGVISIHSLPGTPVLRHRVDARDRASFIFDTDEVAVIITGLLADQSFEHSERMTLSATTHLRGTYTMAFPDHPDVYGDVTVDLRQSAITLIPTGCGCGCECSTTPTLADCGCNASNNCQSSHRTIAQVRLGAPKPTNTTNPRHPSFVPLDDNAQPVVPYDVPSLWRHTGMPQAGSDTVESLDILATIPADRYASGTILTVVNEWIAVTRL